MATNSQVNWYTANNEQTLVENLVVESLRFFGHDVKYVPRTAVNEDTILNEYEYSNFADAWDIEVYIKNTSSFEGQGLFLEKFGLQIKDQMTLTISKKSFSEFITTEDNTITRPREGDLIYIPMLNALYEINFVDVSAVFYQLGRLNTWEITAELYEASQDTFNTGNTSIDDYSDYSNTAAYPYNQDTVFEAEANTILDLSENNPFTDGF